MSVPVDVSVPVAEWPLVGRDDEVRRVCSALGGGRSVVLAGPAGVGKSRVAHEALRRCAHEGLVVLRVSATRASSGIPLGAFASLLGVETVRRDAGDDRAALLSRCVADLVARTEGVSAVLGVDDAHLLDAMSATVVHQVAQRGAPAVVATVRSGERAPDPVTALWKDGPAERVDLGGMTAPVVGALLEAVLGARPDDAAVAMLTARSRGNVLFLRELVVGALADGVLCDDGGIWRLVGELNPTDRLVELVEERLEGLATPERELLEVVAFGEPLRVDELTAIGSAAVAEQLERRGLLRTGTRPSGLVIRLGHPVYGDVLRGRTPGLRARAVARLLAETVENRSGRGAGDREDLLRVATWRLVGGGAGPEPMYRAAVEARWRYDFALAERLARAAVERGAGLPAAVLAAQLASLQGRTAQADAELEAATRQAATAAERGGVALVRLDNRVIYAGTIDAGLRIAAEAEAELGDGELRDEIVARRGALELAKEGPLRALAVLAPLLERTGDATGDPIGNGTGDRALAWACMPGSYALARLGRVREALDVARRGRAAQARLTTPVDWYEFMHAFYEAEALAYAGRFAEAAALAHAQYREGVEAHSLEQQALFGWQRAKSTADRGDVDDAERHVRGAIGIYRQLGRAQFVDFCRIYLAQTLALAGRADEAAATLADLDRSGVTPSYFMGVDVLTARGWVDAAAGNLPRARERFLRAGAEGEQVGDRVGTLAALHGAARIGAARAVVEGIEAAADGVEGDLVDARVRHVRGLAASDARMLVRVSESFEAMGAGLLAAEAAADGARAWSREHDRRAAVAAARRASELATRCPGARTPALAAIEVRARLTDAEWSTARSAAAGRSNREIAAELVVSVRTVENRLQSVYEKLGVRRRAELGAVLAAHLG